MEQNVSQLPLLESYACSLNSITSSTLGRASIQIKDLRVIVSPFLFLVSTRRQPKFSAASSRWESFLLFQPSR
jgi:hypothetical protein